MADRKPKLRVITTGGTIGMVRDADGIARPPAHPDKADALLGPLAERYRLDVLPMCNRDSTNMQPADWHAIAQQIVADDNDSNAYDGTVVVHGTDTLAHAACTVALTLGPPPRRKPVVFTGAQRTAEAEDFDGLLNFGAACGVASSALGEVAIVFHGRILRGCRAAKISATQLDAFASPTGDDLGRVEADHIELYDHAVRRDAPAFSGEWREGLGLEQEVLALTITPGVSPDLLSPIFETPGRCRGVLLSTMGAGNLPDRTGCDWIGFVRERTLQDIPVLLTSRFWAGRTDQNDYALGRAAVAAGGIVVPDLAPACSEMKFRYAIAQALADGVGVCDAVRTAMRRSYFGEAGGLPERLAGV